MIDKIQTVVRVPRPNLNGNKKDDLQEQLNVAAKALRTAIKAVRGTSDVAHGRNYQHLTGDAHEAALTQAQDQHADRLVRLEWVRNELVALVLGIEDGLDEVAL